MADLWQRTGISVIAFFLIGLPTIMTMAAETSTADDALARAAAFIAEHEKIVGPKEREPASPGGMRMSQGGMKISRRRNSHRIASTPRYPTRQKFDRLKELQEQGQHDSAIHCSRDRSTSFTCSIWKSRSTPRFSGRSPPRPTPSRRRSTSIAPTSTARQMTDSEVRKVLKESQRLGRAQGRLGGEQGGRPARRGRPEGAGQAPQRGGTQARLRELPRDAAPPQRADRRSRSSSSSTSSTS